MSTPEYYLKCASVVLEATSCNLCENAPHTARWDGSEFGIDGRICDGCRNELRDERAARRAAKLKRLSITAAKSESKRLAHVNRVYHLPVLDGDFSLSDLTPRAMALVILRQTKRVFRGGVESPKPAASPCAACGTTGGHVKPGSRTPLRRSGNAFGIAGHICATCYNSRNAKKQSQRVRVPA